MRLNFLMTCIAIAAVIIMVTFFMTVPERWNQTEPETAQDPSEAAEDYDYMLKEHEGKLAIFFCGENQPKMVFDVYINTLPDYDKKQLRSGVLVKDYEELLIRIEDYSS